MNGGNPIQRGYMGPSAYGGNPSFQAPQSMGQAPQSAQPFQQAPLRTLSLPQSQPAFMPPRQMDTGSMLPQSQFPQPDQSGLIMPKNMINSAPAVSADPTRAYQGPANRAYQGAAYSSPQSMLQNIAQFNPALFSPPGRPPGVPAPTNPFPTPAPQPGGGPTPQPSPMPQPSPTPSPMPQPSPVPGGGGLSPSGTPNPYQPNPGYPGRYPTGTDLGQINSMGGNPVQMSQVMANLLGLTLNGNNYLNQFGEVAGYK